MRSLKNASRLMAASSADLWFRPAKVGGLRFGFGIFFGWVGCKNRTHCGLTGSRSFENEAQGQLVSTLPLGQLGQLITENRGCLNIPSKMAALLLWHAFQAAPQELRSTQTGQLYEGTA